MSTITSFHKDLTFSSEVYWDLEASTFKNIVKQYCLKLIRENSDGFPPDLVNQLFTGKMSRSKICLALSRSSELSRQDLVYVAASIEIIHEASLIHDDIQDKEIQRRGMPTCYAKYGTEVALNWGDFLLTMTNKPIIDSSLDSITKVNCIDSINKTFREMLKGQSKELANINKEFLEFNEYFEISDYKTGSLLYLISDLIMPLKKAEKIREALKQLSRVYQIKNDLVGFSKAEKSRDFQNQISSFPNIYLRRLRQEDENFWSHPPRSYEISKIIEIVKTQIHLRLERVQDILSSELGEESVSLVMNVFGKNYSKSNEVA